jgi:hypothetical protein
MYVYKILNTESSRRANVVVGSRRPLRGWVYACMYVHMYVPCFTRASFMKQTDFSCRFYFIFLFYFKEVGV